jgi:hypothetical protein
MVCVFLVVIESCSSLDVGVHQPFGRAQQCHRVCQRVQRGDVANGMKWKSGDWQPLLLRVNLVTGTICMYVSMCNFYPAF